MATSTSRISGASRILAVIATAGLAYIVITTVVLHFLETGYNPVTQAVSDYAVGNYSTLMMLGFLAGGIGNVSLSVALSRRKGPSRFYRLGTLLVLVAGVAIFAVGFFPTDLEGSSATTTHGLIHSLVSQIVFITWPLGMLFVSYDSGRRQFLVSLLGLIGAGVVFALNGILSMNIAGLSERIFIAVLLSWSLIVSFQIYMSGSQRQRAE